MLAAQLAVAAELLGGELADVDQFGEDLRARPRGASLRPEVRLRARALRAEPALCGFGRLSLTK
jgi:hypothetical protein